MLDIGDDHGDLLLDLGPAFACSQKVGSYGKSADLPKVPSDFVYPPSRSRGVDIGLVDLTADEDVVVSTVTQLRDVSDAGARQHPARLTVPSTQHQQTNGKDRMHSDLYEAWDEDEEPTSRRGCPPVSSWQRSPLSSSDLNLLPSPKRRRLEMAKQPPTGRIYDDIDDLLDSDQGTHGIPQSKRPKKARLSQQEKDANAAERLAAQEAKKLDKQREKEEKAAKKAEEKAAKDAAKAAHKESKSQERLEQRRARGSFAVEDIHLRMDPTVLSSKGNGWQLLQALSSTPYSFDHTQSLALSPLRSFQWQRRKPSAAATSTAPVEMEDVPYVVLLLTAEQAVEEATRDDLSGIVRRVAHALPGYTLCLLIEGLDHHLTQRERRDYKAAGPGGGGFTRAHTDRVIASMAVRWPGVRHRLVPDTAAAAEHVTVLTKVLAEQPYSKQEAFLGSFGGARKDAQAAAKVMSEHPLNHHDKKVLFNALAHVPDLGPAQAQPLAASFCSLGLLMSCLLDPARSQATEKQIANMTRAGSSMRIGPAATRRLSHIFTASDPSTPIQDLPT